MQLRHAPFLLALALGPSPASAELWVGDVGELFAGATQISVVVDGKVTRSLRGPAAGATVQVPSWFEVGAAKGQELLVVCDRHVCPRAVGVRHGDLWVLDAYEPGDGAWLFPGILASSSLDALAAGDPVPALCLRASIRWIDGGKAAGFATQLDPKSGQGTIAAKQLAKEELSLRVRVADARRGELLLAASGTTGTQAFVGGPPRRADDGCLELEVLPVAPLSRTPAAMARAFAGRTVDQVLARGKLELDGGKAYAAKLVLGANGDLRFESAWLRQPARLWSTSWDAKTLLLGFATDDQQNKVIRLAAAPPTVSLEAGVGAAVAAQLAAAGGEVRWPATWRQGRQPEHVIGSVRLRYVAESNKK